MTLYWDFRGSVGTRGGAGGRPTPSHMSSRQGVLHGVVPVPARPGRGY